MVTTGFFRRDTVGNTVANTENTMENMIIVHISCQGKINGRGNCVKSARCMVMVQPTNVPINKPNKEEATINTKASYK